MQRPRPLRRLLVLAEVVCGVLSVIGADDLERSCEVEAYYDARQDLSSLAGHELQTALHELVRQHRSIPYTSSSTTDTWDALRDLDKDPSDDSRVMLIYKQTADLIDNQGIASGWNREHLWPRSFGVGSSGPDTSDLHALRPSDWNVNAARGNLPFGWCNASTSCRDMPAHAEAADTTGKDSTTFMPPRPVRGDIARACFYMAVRYGGSEPNTEDLQLSDCPCRFRHAMGRLSVLLQWHALDPPSDAEIRRNDKLCRRYQGNRNPFVDKPELAHKAFAASAAGAAECPPCQASADVSGKDAAVAVGTHSGGVRIEWLRLSLVVTTAVIASLGLALHACA